LAAKRIDEGIRRIPEKPPIKYTGCPCYTCLDKDYQTRLANGEKLSDLVFNHPVWLFIVCKKCGNKRCPHATNHRLKCTNSNEPGQKGSNYE
jgi:ribosomal protein L40E